MSKIFSICFYQKVYASICPPLSRQAVSHPFLPVNRPVKRKAAFVQVDITCYNKRDSFRRLPTSKRAHREGQKT